MSRLRTFTLWTGTLLSLLIAAAFVASAWWYITLQVPTARGPAMHVRAGEVMLTIDELITVPVFDTHGGGLRLWNTWQTGWLLDIPQDPRSRLVTIEFPLYALLLAVAIPTLLVWRFWPKPVPPGHCRCGYDLTGNESERCP